MDPVMIQIGPLAIRWYGFLIALSVLIGSLWAARLAVRRGLDADKLFNMAPYLVIAGLVGSRLVYVVTSPEAFFGPGGDLLDIIRIWKGGVSIHGGVAGVMVAAWICRGINMWSCLDVMTPLGALGIMGGRIGNFMNGTDSGGRLTDWIVGFTWPEVGTPALGAFGRVVFGDVLWRFSPPICSSVPMGEPCTLHLTPLYGFLVGFLLLFVVLWALRRSSTPGFAFAQFALWYSVFRSLIEEPFRDNPLFWQLLLDDRAGVGVLTLTQLVSLPIILVALYALLMIDPDREKKREHLARRTRGR